MAHAPISVGPPPAIDAAFLQAMDVFGATAARVPAPAWGNASPCAGWTARDVAGHVVGTVTKAAAILGGEAFPPGPSRPEDGAGDDPVAAWRAASRPARESVGEADLSREIDMPRGRGTAAQALAFPTADLIVHAWDIAHAAGLELSLPAELLAHIVATCAPVPEETLRGPDLFGPAREAPDGADDTARLMAWLGRDPGS